MTKFVHSRIGRQGPECCENLTIGVGVAQASQTGHANPASYFLITSI